MKQPYPILHPTSVSEQDLPQVWPSNMKASDQYRYGYQIAHQLALQPPGRILISRAVGQLAWSAIIPRDLIVVENCNTVNFPEAHFAVIVLNGVLGNDVNAPTVLSTLWRFLKPGGRIIIRDQFRPEPGQYRAWLALMGQVMTGMRQAPVWHLSDILRHSDLICIEQNEPDPLHPFYRWVTLSKPMS